MGVSLSPHKGTAAKTRSRLRRQLRGRKKIFGSTERPRLVITRSARHISAQVIDDVSFMVAPGEKLAIVGAVCFGIAILILRRWPRRHPVESSPAASAASSA